MEGSMHDMHNAFISKVSKRFHLQPLWPMEALENASLFAQAYSVGRLEASAAINLLNHMSPNTRDRLKELVRPYHRNIIRI